MRKTVLLLLVLVACSDESKVYTDAAVGPDGPEADADTSPDGTVHVTAFARNDAAPGTRFAGAEILVFGVDGTLRDRAQTDANGEATVDVNSGDSVTAVYELVADAEVNLATFAGVQPGDDLTFGDALRPATTGAVTGSMTVTWPALTGSTSASLRSSCGTQAITAAQTSVVVQQRDDCATDPFSVLLTSEVSGVLTEWGALHDADFSDTGTIAISSLNGPGTFSVALTGIADEVTYYEVDVFSAVDDAVFNATNPYYVYAYDIDGMLAGSIPWADGVDGAIVRSYWDRPGNYGGQQSQQRLAPGVATITTPDEPLPWLSDSVLTNPRARAIQWFQLGAQPYDVGLVALEWSTGSGPTTAFGPTSTDYTWNIFLPPGQVGLVFPELPSDLLHLAPTADTSIYTRIELYETTAVDGYDAVRALPEWEVACLYCTPSGAATYPHVRASYTGGGGSDLVAPSDPARAWRKGATLRR